MADIIIKNTSNTTNTEGETANVVVSSRNKLFDATEALKKEPIIMKASAAIEPEATPAVEEPPQKILYTTTTTEPVFSWQKTATKTDGGDVVANADLSDKTVDELLAEAEPKAQEFVYVTEEVKKPGFFTSITSNVFNAVVVLIFLAALFVGGKTAFDYVQEAESIKAIASKLESQTTSDIPLPTVKALADFGSGGTTTETKSLKSDGFVKIIRTKAYYLLAQRKDGKIELRTGGSVGWRTNNPGEFGYGDFAKKTGAIDKYSKYAIYPSLEKGMIALETYLFSTNLYRNLSIQEAMKKFYGSDKTSAETVARGISVALNVSRYKTKLSSLKNSQKVKMIKVIQDHVGDLKGITRIYNDMDDFNKRGF
jgi:hypothetical protein